MVQVYFIGAGPGDVELLTIKASKIIKKADVIVYADSLVNPDICALAPEGAKIYKSSSRTLEETSRIIVDAVKAGETVARLHSGDPSLYGAISEQMSLLDERGIQYEIIPGVSSLFAAAALLKIELTVPEVSQTVIITRREGRTPVPLPENLRSLATHGATIALFLSTAQARQSVKDLMEGGYEQDTPAAVVYKVGWKDQKFIKTSLVDLPEQMEECGIRKQALILVGKSLDSRLLKKRSRLYSRGFKHEYRK